MSELIQEEKYISYENFIPNWTELIEEMSEKGIEKSLLHRMSYASERGYNFNNCRQCLVGEGYKGNDNYVGFQFNGKELNEKKCDTCTTMCAMPASNALTYGEKAFDLFKRNFYDHMIDAHPDLMVKRD